LPGGQNPGNIDPKRLKEIADAWGALPEKERAKAMQELLPQLPPKYRDEIRKYIRAISDAEGTR
jgi:hypothetical protein